MINTELHKIPDTVVEFEKQISELEAEVASLKQQQGVIHSEPTADNSEVETISEYKAEIERLKREYEDTLVELLRPAFYNNDEDARDFLKRVRGLDSLGVVAVARQFVKDNKIIPRHKKSFIWKILKAAKLYDKSEQNWGQQIDIQDNAT